METIHTMKSIMLAYPGFQDLPKGVKKMLLASETFFFGEARMQTIRPARSANPFGGPSRRDWTPLVTPLHEMRRMAPGIPISGSQPDAFNPAPAFVPLPRDYGEAGAGVSPHLLKG